MKNIDKIKDNNAERIYINRSRITFKIGEYVKFEKYIYQISQLIDYEKIIGINIKTNKAKVLEINKISAVDVDKKYDNNFIYDDLDNITDKNYAEMIKRYDAIKPLLKENISKLDVLKHAESIKIHYTTLYKWIKKYKSTGTLLGLISKKRGILNNTSLIDIQVEQIIQQVIKSFYVIDKNSPEKYLHTKPKPLQLIRKINKICIEHNLTPPAENTIRNRIKKLKAYEVEYRNTNKKLADEKYKIMPGSYSASFPLEVVQIDHTPVDLILVDDKNRLPIGRPWITVAIDIYSRMIVGYHLSLDAPCSTSVGMCISNMIIPKDKILIENDIDLNWDVWGFPKIIHVDNGADFRSKSVEKACLVHDIDIIFRPIRKTNYGGHIERLIGTVMKEIHSIPGTTYSNTKEKDQYNSDKYSCITFDELNKYIITYIIEVYHQKLHKGIGTTPEQKWLDGIFGILDQEGIGLQAKPESTDTIYIDFLPSFERTIQKNGINIDGLNYYDYILKSKKYNSELNDNQEKEKFIVRRDPRDISYIFFYDEINKEYVKIPLADQNIPHMSLWQYKAIKKFYKDRNELIINPVQIQEGYDKLYGIVKQASLTTNKVNRQKRLEQQKIVNNKKIQSSQSKQITKNNKDNNTVNSTKNKKSLLNINVDFEVDESIWDDDIPEYDYD